MQVKKVLLLDNVDPTAKTILEENNIEATLFAEKLTVDQLVQKLQDYEGVVVRSATKMTADIIEKCPNLRVIGRAGTGVDNIDLKAATKCGVVVMNTPGGNTLSAAEHTCTLICCMARNVPAANISMKAGKWERKAFMGHELNGKTLAIIGLGRIGREVASRMQSFGMTTIGFDPMVTKENAAQDNIEWLSLDEIWPRADYITVHTPLIPQTRGLLNKASFGKCKKGVRVVNCARGGIIDENDLLEALVSGQCGGAGLDVFEQEPPTNQDLVNHQMVIACPHLGASTKEAQSRCGREVAQQIADVCSGQSFFGVMNAPALNQVQSKEVGDKCKLSRFMSCLLSSIAKSSATVNVKLSECDMKKGKAGVSASVCAGLVANDNKNVNVVNSATLAEKSGHKVNLESGASDSIEMSLKSDSMSLSIVGSTKGGLFMLDSIDGNKFASPVHLDQNFSVVKSSNPAQDLGKICASGNVQSINLAGNWIVFNGGNFEGASTYTAHCF